MHCYCCTTEVCSWVCQF